MKGVAIALVLALAVGVVATEAFDYHDAEVRAYMDEKFPGHKLAEPALRNHVYTSDELADWHAEVKAAEGMRFAELRGPHTKATKVVKDGEADKEVAATSSDASASATSMDLSNIKRECPRKECPKTFSCGLPSGVCCGNGHFCCPSGYSCLTTNPPTCVEDSDKNEFSCAEEECIDGHHCPHNGVDVCCRGGETCCADGYKCQNSNPPTCALIDSQKEKNHQEAANEQAEKDKNAEEKSDTDSDDSSSDDSGSSSGDSSGSSDDSSDSSGSSDDDDSKAGQDIDLTGTCTLGTVSGCGDPKSWKSTGVSGLIVHASHDKDMPLANGGRFNGGWNWNHPFTCCAQTNDASLAGKMIMAKSCPEGTKDYGWGGIILKSAAADYAKNPFGGGGGFNSGWRWSHPRMCLVKSDFKASDDNSGWCMLANRDCPAGLEDHGRGGLIFMRKHYSTQPFPDGGRGGLLNDSWRWVHPTVCCKK